MALEDATRRGRGSTLSSPTSAKVGRRARQHMGGQLDGSCTKEGANRPQAADDLTITDSGHGSRKSLEKIASDLIEEWEEMAGRTGPRWWLLVDDFGRVGVDEPEWQAAFATDGAPSLGLWQTPPDDPAVLQLVAQKVHQLHASAVLVVLPGNYEPGAPEATDGQECFAVQCWSRSDPPLVVTEASTAVGEVVPGAWGAVEAALIGH